MKPIEFIKPAILLFCTIACINRNHEEKTNDTVPKDAASVSNAVATDTFETGKVITQVVCKTDPSQSYALYIPAKGSSEALPVVYFFDPHGNGALPLNKYKSLADQFGFILAGSNNSKNGADWSTLENTWNALANDSQKRLKINRNRIYACGFSGGAKVASYIGLNHTDVKGVIANGAGLPEMTRSGNFHFSFTAIAGEGDMNMSDLAAINADLDKTQTRHRILFFDGKHEWAPENTMGIAFAGLELDAMREKIIPADNTFIGTYISESKKRIAGYLTANNYLKAERECQLSISLLEGLVSDAAWFKEKDNSIKSNPVYGKQWRTKQDLLATEQKLKETYSQQFERGDMNYWASTIGDLQTKAKAQTELGAMYQRLLAYLSLAFYSISNQLINNHQDKDARFFVDLYKLVDASNSEAWYFSAVLNARSNNARAAEDDLSRAVDNGFTDINRMMQQPEFQSAGTQINLQQIAGKIKKG